MRVCFECVCFDGLCFASRRSRDTNQSREEETQTVLCDGAITLNDHHHHHHNITSLLKYNNIGPTTTAPTSVLIYHQKKEEVLDIIKMSDPQAGDNSSSFQTLSSQPQLSASASSSLQASSQNYQQQTQDQIVNNHSDTTGLNNQLENILITDKNPSDNETGTTTSTSMRLTPNEQELLKLLHTKDVKIRELEDQLRRKNDEVAELRSHLDKFQSVFPFSRSPSGGLTPAANAVVLPGPSISDDGASSVRVQRQRATGISAEPQSERKVLERLHVTFRKYDKEER